MDEEYVKEKEWFKCTIDGIVYDCHLEYFRSRLLSKPWVKVTVRKYTQKKWWFFKWKEEEFECDAAQSLNHGERIWINKTVYFKSEYIKSWVKGALNRRESKIREKKSQQELEKKLKVIKHII